MAPLSTARIPDTHPESTTNSETTVSSTSTTHTAVSSTASHTPHTSVDLHPTTEVVSHGLVYSVAGVTPTTEHTTIPSASHATSRFPKLSIPTFTGDPLNWQSFWDCFDSAVNSNPTLSNVQKLSYLRAQLHSPLPTNLTLCGGRTRALARRLAASPELLTTYNNILKDQERRGFIEKINLPAVNSYCHYITHHAVKKSHRQPQLESSMTAAAISPRPYLVSMTAFRLEPPSYKTYVQLL